MFTMHLSESTSSKNGIEQGNSGGSIESRLSAAERNFELLQMRYNLLEYSMTRMSFDILQYKEEIHRMRQNEKRFHNDLRLINDIKCENCGAKIYKINQIWRNLYYNQMQTYFKVDTIDTRSVSSRLLSSIETESVKMTPCIQNNQIYNDHNIDYHQHKNIDKKSETPFIISDSDSKSLPSTRNIYSPNNVCFDNVEIVSDKLKESHHELDARANQFIKLVAEKRKKYQLEKKKFNDDFKKLGNLETVSVNMASLEAMETTKKEEDWEKELSVTPFPRASERMDIICRGTNNDDIESTNNNVSNNINIDSTRRRFSTALSNFQEVERFGLELNQNGIENELDLEEMEQKYNEDLKENETKNKNLNQVESGTIKTSHKHK